LLACRAIAYAGSAERGSMMTDNPPSTASDEKTPAEPKPTLPPALERWRKAWLRFGQYDRFERIALRIVQILLALMTVYAIVLVIGELARDAALGAGFMDKAVLQDAFGSILTVLILLEFNHSVHVAVSQRSGAIQVRIIVLITVLVIMRKLMLLDYETATIQTLLGFAALLLALGALYWLIMSGDARRAR
jgi:uncharacterized membrane protein (DUF373 family)